MTFLADMRTRLQSATGRTRIKSWLFSLAFGLFVVAVFYVIRWIIPQNLVSYNQTVTILFIIIAVLILFPARARILARFLRRNEYTRYFGQDYHHLDFIARQFSVETLVGEVFPELMEWLGVRHGRLAVLEPSRRSYRFHVYRNGRLLKSRHSYERRAGDPFIRSLRHRRTGLDVAAPDLSPEVRTELERLGAARAHPFVFRGRLLGFLILHEPPRTRHAARALDFFSDKAAVSIQNYILTYRMIDSRLYDAELHAAARVQSILHNAPSPRIPGIALRRTEQRQFTSILEFFHAGEERWFVAGLSSERLTSAAGIVLYGVFGRLYSFIQREDPAQITMQRLLAALKRGLADRADYSVDVLLMELQPASGRLVVLLEGDRYSVVEISKPARTIVSRGWRNFLEMKPDETYRVSYNDRPLLELRRLSEAEREAAREEDAQTAEAAEAAKTAEEQPTDSPATEREPDGKANSADSGGRP